MAHLGFGEQREDELDVIPKSRVSTARVVAPGAGVSGEWETTRCPSDNEFATERRI